LVAAAVTVFAGLAVFSFYQPPKSPAYPSGNYTYGTAAYNRQQATYDAALAQHDKDEKTYYRNATYMLLPLAIVSTLAGLYLMRRYSEAVGEGLTLGGVAIMSYALIMASLADGRILRFVVVTLLLITVLLVAHFRFAARSAKPQHPPVQN
jgi:hypothetical protein